MAREPKTTQDTPTQSRPVDADGHTLDQWGLPENGPTRRARLAEMDRPDPLEAPEAWAEPAAAAPTDTPAQD